MMTMSGKVLSERLDVLRLTFYTAPISCMCLTPFFVAKEVRRDNPHALVPACSTQCFPVT